MRSVGNSVLQAPRFTSLTSRQRELQRESRVERKVGGILGLSALLILVFGQAVAKTPTVRILELLPPIVPAVTSLAFLKRSREKAAQADTILA